MANRSLFFGLIIILACSAKVTAAQTLVREGRPVARIFVATGSEPLVVAGREARDGPLNIAVRDLNYHLEKMSGTRLEVVDTDDPALIRGPSIVLGKLAKALGAEPQKRSQSGEGFRLLTRGERLLIAGESDRAVLLGVYALLERLGCDWVMPGPIGEIIPRRKTISVPTLDESQAPDFSMRRLWYRGGSGIVSAEERGRLQEWLRRQRGGDYEPIAQQTGGHYWGAFIKKHKAEFDRDPTMYALRPVKNGELRRLGPQIESTHPRVVALMVQDIKDTFAKRGWSKDRIAGFPIGPADGAGFSESPEALAAGAGRFDAYSGVADQSDHLVLLANRIFAGLGNAYSNVYLGYYSYGAHANFPKRYRPHPRLVQIFAPISYSRYHSVVDPTSRSQLAYRQVVEQWAALSRTQGNPLIFRGYNWNLAENLLPYTKLRIWGEELPFYKRMRIIGLNVEATKAWSINGPSDWLYMKLAWDSSLDWKALLHEYCTKSFGAGAPSMEAYFLRLAERQHSAGQEAGSYHAIPLIFDREFVARARRDIEEAVRLAGTPEQKTRAKHFAHAIGALDRYLDYYEATTRFDFVAAKQSFDAMFDHWQQAYAQDSDLVAKEGPQYLDRFIRPFVEGALASSTASFGIPLRVPDGLQTAFASRSDGERLGYQRREADESAFTLTKTYSSTWDAQGLGGHGSAIWYRFRFRLPASMHGKPLSLFLGSFDDQATVWINGQLVGTSGRQFSRPANFDLTGKVEPDRQNLLAIHIERSRGLNEIGIGGLFRPSFLFAGR